MTFLLLFAGLPAPLARAPAPLPTAPGQAPEPPALDAPGAASVPDARGAAWRTLPPTRILDPTRLATTLAAARREIASLEAGEGADRRALRPGADLRAAALEAAGLLRRRGTAVEVGGLEHRPFVLHKDGLPILNRRGRLHRQTPGRSREGRLPRAITGALTFPPLATADWRIADSDAVERARREIGVRAERASPRVERGAWARPGGTRPVWRVTIPASRPLGTWQVVVDAETGAVLDLGNQLRSTHCDPDDGNGLLYPRNPVTTPVLQETCLREIVPPDDDSFGFLSGRITRVYDVRAVEAFRRDLLFDFAPDDPRFVQTSAYRTVTETGRFAEAFGFPVFSTPIRTFTNVPGFTGEAELNNAFYDPFFPLIVLGNGDGSLTANLGIDSDVAAHEMGHHLFQILVDPSPSSRFAELAAMNEAVADTVAALMGGDPNIGESTIPGQPALRTLANRLELPADGSASPHQEGLIFGGMNWDLRQQIGADEFASILLAALPFLDPASNDPNDWRDALLAGDVAVTGGTNDSRIRQLADQRGLDFLDEFGFRGEFDTEGRQEDTVPDGEAHLWLFQEFPPAAALRVFLLGVGGGDADLLVAPIADLDRIATSTFIGTSNERVDITTATIPSVEDDDLWLVVVQDFPDGSPSSYLLSAQTDLAPPDLQIGDTITGTLDRAGAVEVRLFDGRRHQIVSVAVTPDDPELDLAVSVVDFTNTPTILLGADDDSGPGRDPHIQGARIPVSRRYALAVFSPTADVDPRIGTGDWSLTLSLCNNVGDDFDGDGQVDACDDDDDDDGFPDAFDSGPRNPALCTDLEPDGCDDCVNRPNPDPSSPPDFFDDGPDLDGDSFCDAGDPDDDNDGCDDEEDVSPRSASEDPDFDFRGDHCDNCPDDFNPDQIDRDADGLGDVCDPTPTPEPATGIAGWVALGMLRLLAGRRRRRLRGCV